MRFKEFKERIEDWGRKHGYVARVGIDYHQTYIKVWSNQAFYFNTYISNKHRFALDTDYTHFKEIEEHARAELFDIIVEFAKTPLEDREDEDEKKYYVKLPWMAKDSQYLNVDTSTGMYFTAKAGEFAIYKTKFTMEEIEKLGEKYNLDSFEIVEVE